MRTNLKQNVMEMIECNLKYGRSYKSLLQTGTHQENSMSKMTATLHKSSVSKVLKKNRPKSDRASPEHLQSA